MNKFILKTLLPSFLGTILSLSCFSCAFATPTNQKGSANNDKVATESFGVLKYQKDLKKLYLTPNFTFRQLLYPHLLFIAI